jgi:hypothetical protein
MATSFLDKLRARAADPARATDDAARVPAQSFPPLGEQAIALAESRIGCRLPAALRNLYLNVGNGGFGPAYGLLGLIGGAKNEDGLDALDAYEQFRQPDSGDPQWRWPTALLPVGHLGCAMFACVDCSSSDGALIWFEPNPHERGEPWDDAFVPLNISIESWLARWLEGSEDDLFEAAWVAKFGADGD